MMQIDNPMRDRKQANEQQQENQNLQPELRVEVQTYKKVCKGAGKKNKKRLNSAPRPMHPDKHGQKDSNRQPDHGQ
jgi:hypothetical protein